MNNRILYIPREEKRIRKNVKRKRLSLRITMTLLLFITLVGGLGIIFRLSYWQVKDIQITGLDTLGAEELRRAIFEFLKGDYALFIPRRVIFFLDSEGLSRRLLKESPKLAEVKVVTHLPDKLHIIVAERKLFGIFCNDLREEESHENQDVTRQDGGKSPSRCAYIDRKGVAYEDAPVSTGTLIRKIRSDRPDFIVQSQLLDESHIRKMESLASELKQGVGEDVVGFELFSKIPQEIRMVTSSGFKIWWKLDGDFLQALRILKTVLDEEVKGQRPRLEYVDLRFGNKVFYKLKK